MINLSQQARDVGIYTKLEQLRLLREPDIYYAKDIRDYICGKKRLGIPWYKRGSFKRVYVILHNVQIKPITEDPKYFWIIDKTAQFVAFWRNQDWFYTPHSYEENILGNGLSEDDILHEVFFRYLVDTDLPNICEVQPYKFQETVAAQVSLRDRARKLLPDLCLQPDLV